MRIAYAYISPHPTVRKANTSSGDIENHVKNNHTAPCMRQEPGDGVDKSSWRAAREKSTNSRTKFLPPPPPYLIYRTARYKITNTGNRTQKRGDISPRTKTVGNTGTATKRRRKHTGTLSLKYTTTQCSCESSGMGGMQTAWSRPTIPRSSSPRRSHG